MRRAVRFIFRNWPLKLAAVVLATLLYAGLIVSASAETFQGRIPIQVLNQPPDTFIMGTLDDVTSIRYVAIGTSRPPVGSSSFTATIDLATTPAGGPPVSVPVVVRATDPGIQVIDVTPSRVQVRLDPLVSKEVSVEVDSGTIPPGLDVRDPVVSQDTVRVSGPESTVRSVAAAVARVRIDPSGIDVNQSVDLIAVDASGAVVDGVDVEPNAVRVTVQIGSKLSTRTLPVNAVVTGKPSATVEIVGVQVAPALVTVEGQLDALAGLTRVDTEPVSVAGIDADTASSTALVLPKGVSALGVSEVRVTIDVEPRAGTRTLEAGVVLRNERADLAYQPAVDSVLVTVGGTLEALTAIDAGALVANLDVGNLEVGRTAVPATFALPAGVDLVTTSPAKVTVTVTAVATPAPSPTATPAEPAPSPTPAP